MAKLLILGDSNIANNLQHSAVLGKEQFEFKKCTTKGLFIDKILAAQQELVVVAGIDCIGNEALTAPRESERNINLVVNNLVSKIIEKLEDDSVTNMAIALASPLYWDEFNDDVKKSLQATFKQIRRDWKHRIRFIPPCPGMKYLQDRVHLDELSGVRYTNHIIKKSCSIAKIIPNPASNPSWADDVELQLMEDEEMEQDDSQQPLVSGFAGNGTGVHQVHRTPQASLSSQPSFQPQPQYLPPPAHQASMSLQPFSQHFPSSFSQPFSQPLSLLNLPAQGSTNQELLQKIDQLTKRMDSAEDKSYYDNLMFAAIKEDQDDLANQRNLDRITLTGVKIENFSRTAENEKPAAMKDAVNSIITLVTPEAERQNREVVFTRHRNRHIRNAKSVVIEARFKNSTQAVAFRKEFVESYK